MVEWSRRQPWFNSGIASQADAERTACVGGASRWKLSLVPLSKQKSSAGPAPSAARTEQWVRTGPHPLPGILDSPGHRRLPLATRAWPQEQWGIHAASFRLLIRVRAEVDGSGVLWALSSPSRKLISPPTRMTKPER